jgi:small ligand-binding sensory domain FIST
LRRRIAGERGGSARKQARGSRFFLGVIGMGKLKDGVDHELVVMDGCERIGK